MLEVRTKKKYDYVINKSVEYVDVPISFDIEASSFYDKDGRRAATMYLWALNDNDNITVGRTWEAFHEALKSLKTKYKVSADRRIICWIHNLPYEWGFIKFQFDWSANQVHYEKNVPIKAMTKDGIEFRCNYAYSGVSLKRLENSRGIKKGEINHDKIRHFATPLSDEEIEYCKNDVRIINSMIEDDVKIFGAICDFPLTNTGKVRRLFRKEFKKDHDWKDTLSRCKLTSEVYHYLKLCLAGGYVAGNRFDINEIIENVSHVDICSSYPFVLTTMKYPIGRPIKVPTEKIKERFNDYLENKACLICARFKGLKLKPNKNPIISRNKCGQCLFEKRYDVWNGRVCAAKSLEIIINEVDLKMIKEFYYYEDLEVVEMWVWVKNYLPKGFVNLVLDIYAKKTYWKGKDKIKEKVYKQLINGIFGMCLTSPIRDTYIMLDGLWLKDTETEERKIKDYNEDKSRFNYFPWGVWCASYAKAQLLSFTSKLQNNDFKYSDTDSCFYTGDYDTIIKEFNDSVDAKIKEAAEAQQIDAGRWTCPTFDGKTRTCGYLEKEKTARRFKFLGSKRYLSEFEDGSYELKNSGVDVDKTLAWLLTGDKDPFEKYDMDVLLPMDVADTKTAFLRDFVLDEDVTDYLGNTAHVFEKSGINIERTDYNLKGFEGYLYYKMGRKQSKGAI